VKIRWPFKKLSYQNWLGINLSELNPSAVIYCAGEIVVAVNFSADEGLAALAQWLKKHVKEGMPAVLVLGDEDYQLLLTEAPDVPDDELNAAMEFRIADLLTRDIAETAIQAIRLPKDAYRGRMSMAHVITASNETIEGWVKWAEELKLNIALITVPELCLLNLLALFEIEQGIGLLELGPKQGCLRLYQAGALYLTRHVEVGITALELNLNSFKEENITSEIELATLDVETSNEDELELELADDITSEFDSAADEYVSFSAKKKVNDQQLENLVLEVQRSLDYYESQLGMGQITRLWLMSGDIDLTDLIEAMDTRLTAKIEQPSITEMLKGMNFHIRGEDKYLNSVSVAIGGALAYAGS
jgi:MSHA biogenesis protein MshI